MEGVLKDIGAVFYSGIRPNIPGQGGEECIKYLSPRQIVGETLLATTIMVVCGSLSWRTFTMAKVFPKLDEPLFKRLLLTFMCILFGIEAGYKICHQSALFLLNPCHVITMIQVHLCVYHTHLPPLPPTLPDHLQCIMCVCIWRTTPCAYNYTLDITIPA